MDFVAIDLELAYNDSTQKDDTPIELANKVGLCAMGIAEVRDGAVVRTKHWFIRSKDGNRISSREIRVHGITPDMTASAPEFPEVWAEVSEIIGDRLLVAHNATSSDICWLRKSLDAYGLPHPDLSYCCTIRASKILLESPPKSSSLENLCKMLGITHDKHHNAEADAVACAELMLRLVRDWQAREKKPWYDEVPIVGFDSRPKGGSKSKGRGVGKGTFHYTPQMRELIESSLTDEMQSQLEAKIKNLQFCFTGEMCLVRHELMQIVQESGAIYADRVSKKTDILLVGQHDYEQRETNQSRKLTRALELVEQGSPLRIMSELDFFSWLHDAEPEG